MTTRLLLLSALAAGAALPAVGQRGRPGDSPRARRRDDQGTTSDTRFAPALRAGQLLAVSNIDGRIVVTQGRGESASIVAHKTVHHGNGDLVKAVLEETSDGYRVCTVYLDDVGETATCDHRNRGGHRDRDEPLDVDMAYEVRLPAGVRLAVNSVDGDIAAHGIDTPATLRTVDGAIDFDGVAPESINTVDGDITATIANADWDHSLAVRSVDGAISLTLPAGISAEVSGRTVDGKLDSDFPLTLTGKWGPQSFHGTIGSGRGPTLDLNTVDGDIRLRSSGRATPRRDH